MLFTDYATAGALARDETVLDVTRLPGVSRGVRPALRFVWEKAGLEVAAQ